MNRCLFMDEKQKLSKFEILRISFLCFALAVYFTIWLTSSEGVSNVVLFNTLVILQYLSFSAVFIAEILNCSKKKKKYYYYIIIALLFAAAVVIFTLRAISWMNFRPESPSEETSLLSSVLCKLPDIIPV